MDNKSKNKNKKRLLILVALVGVMGIGGVVAATSISINGGVPISLGAGYTTATTCDSAVTITAGQGYNATTNLYEVNALNVTDVLTTSGNCNNKIMQLAYVTTANTAVQASWTLPSSSTNYLYIFGTTSPTPKISGTNYYATATLTAFDIATLSTVALSIS
jgi:hypothetical protein